MPISQALTPDLVTPMRIARSVCVMPDREKVVDSLYIREDVDVYITGSNAYMLSSELATLLSGRYTEIKMLPLSSASIWR